MLCRDKFIFNSLHVVKSCLQKRKKMDLDRFRGFHSELIPSVLLEQGTKEILVVTRTTLNYDNFSRERRIRIIF